MKKLVAGFGVCAALIIVGCSAVDAALSGDGVGAVNETVKFGMGLEQARAKQAEYEAKNFTPENQYYLGRGVSAAVFKAFPAADLGDAKVAAMTDYVNMIGQYLLLIEGAPAQYRGYNFGVIQTSEPAAFSTPGGFVWVGTGMAALANNEDEFAAAIAHETAHAILMHSIIKYDEGSDARITNAVFAKAAEDAVALSIFEGAVSDIADSLLTNDYSVEFEYQADEMGCDLLHKAGYDPNALVRLLETVDAFINKQGKEKAGKYLAGHPPTKDRIKRVKDHIAKKGYKGSVNPARTERFLRYFPR